MVVNSEDEEMLERARILGAETVKRDPYFASSSVIMSDVYVNMAEHTRADVIMYANATNPLVRTETYEKAIREYLEKTDRHDSLNSATLQKLFLWQDGKPINYDPARQPRSQDLPDIYSINFAISLISREGMIQYRNVVGRTPYIFRIDAQEGLDIDTELDFEIAEYMYSVQKR